MQYATASELASYLQKDLDTASATQALTLASTEFSAAADTWFTPQSVTYVTTGTRATGIVLPYHPVTSVEAVRINGVAVAGYTLIGRRLYRYSGFGTRSVTVPDLLEVDLVHGYAAVPDDVKLAVLTIAAGLYENPTGIASESIDDYSVKYNGVPILPGRPWREVAAGYRGVLLA